MDFLKKKWYVDDTKFTLLYIQSEVVRKWKLPALVKSKLLQKWVDKALIDQTMNSLYNEMQEWVHTRIRKEIDKLKKKGIDGYDIIIKISQKGYKISDIKKAIQSKTEEE
jgi:SOS response regulatory protein OraA/RecX